MDRVHAFGTGPLRAVPEGDPGLWRRVLARAIAAGQRVADSIAFEAAAISFARGSVHGRGLLVGPRALCINRGARGDISLGERVVVRGVLRVDFAPGKIILGDGVYVGDDVLISAMSSVRVGARTMLAHGVQIFDNDSHPVDPEVRRRDHEAIFAGGSRPKDAIGRAPVEIGADAWIGAGSLIMKGVTIGDGSIVAAGSVVVRDVPAGTVAAGNPARVVKTMAPGER